MTLPLPDEPKQLPDGRWSVGERAFATNAQAWRHIDRLNNEPISRSEDVGDWVFNKMANERFAKGSR